VDGRPTPDGTTGAIGVIPGSLAAGAPATEPRSVRYLSHVATLPADNPEGSSRLVPRVTVCRSRTPSVSSTVLAKAVASRRCPVAGMAEVTTAGMSARR
jgi:hypothetical protein